MQNHLEKDHLSVFDAFEELAAYVEGKPILSKISLIIKRRETE